MAAIPFPTVNGVLYDYSTIETTLIIDGKGSQIVLHIGDISYSDSIERAHMYGQNQAPLGLTPGQYTPGEMKLTMAKQSHAALVDLIGNGHMEASLNFVVSYSWTGLPLITDTIEGCKPKGSNNAHASGPDALMVEIPFDFNVILLNGKTPLVNHLR